MKAKDALGRPEQERNMGPQFILEEPITEEQWSKIDADYQYWEQNAYEGYQSWRTALRIATGVMVLRPDARSFLRLDSLPVDEIAEEINTAAVTNARALAPDFFILFPQHRDKITQRDQIAFHCQQRINGVQQAVHWVSESSTLVKYAILDPERFSHLIEDRDIWGELEEAYRLAKESRSYEIMMRLAAEMTLLFPDRKQEIPIDDEDWWMFQNKLRGTIKQETNVYSKTSDNALWWMGILTAKQASITPEGTVQIQFWEEELDAPTPLPARPAV